jgi:hypothetical protein
LGRLAYEVMGCHGDFDSYQRMWRTTGEGMPGARLWRAGAAEARTAAPEVSNPVKHGGFCFNQWPEVQPLVLRVPERG